jgi:hypothetical protein
MAYYAYVGFEQLRAGTTLNVEITACGLSRGMIVVICGGNKGGLERGCHDVTS